MNDPLKNKACTIKDIAQRAGVSKTTISRYLNGKYEYMSEETVERIRGIIDVTGYKPSNIARSLKNRKSMLIGLIVADIESPFSSACIKSIGDAARKIGYSLLIANSDNDLKKENKCIQSMLQHQVDGLIFNAVSYKNSNINALSSNNLPVVLLDRFVESNKYDIAYLDCDKPIDAAITHLKQQGYGRIALLTQPYEDVSPRFLRRDSFIKYMSAIDSAPEGLVYSSIPHSADSFCNTLSRLLVLSRKDDCPPAVIVTNGVASIYAVRAAKSLGLSIPDELGICGYDEWGWASDIIWDGMLESGFTTLTSSIQSLGESTVRLLSKRMSSPEAPLQQEVIPASLIIRGSTQR
jgi:LacI family kdg operon repressor